MTDLSSHFSPDEKKFSQPKPKKGLIVKKKKDAGSELTVMKAVFLERGGRCEITGEELQFHPTCIHHILRKSQNQYPEFKLYKKNLVVLHAEVHFCLEHNTKETFLKHYPKGQIIFDRAEELKIEYGNLPKI